VSTKGEAVLLLLYYSNNFDVEQIDMPKVMQIGFTRLQAVDPVASV